MKHLGPVEGGLEDRLAARAKAPTPLEELAALYGAAKDLAAKRASHEALDPQHDAKRNARLNKPLKAPLGALPGAQQAFSSETTELPIFSPAGSRGGVFYDFMRVYYRQLAEIYIDRGVRNRDESP